MKIFTVIFILLMFYSCNTNAQNCNVPLKLIEEIENAHNSKEFIKDDFFRINKLLFEYEFEDSLQTLSDCNAYKISISALFDSENEVKRALAYRLIGVVKDSSFNDELHKRINSDESTFLKTWSSFAIMYNGVSAASDDLFQLFSSYPEDFPVDILINIYLDYDPIAVKKTCWKFIDSDIKNEQIMAIQCLANFEQNEDFQQKLKEFIVEWDNDTKGWVISSMSIQKMENLESILSPYVEIDHLRGIIIRALMSSPMQSDNEYAEELKNDK